MDLVIFTIGAADRGVNSGVAHEALPQDGSQGKHRKTQVKAVVWQGVGVGQAPHTGDVFRGRTLKQRSRAGSQQPGRRRPRPASAGLGSAGVRSSSGPPGWLPGSGRALKATVSAAAAAATPHPSGSGPGAAR